MLTKTFHFAEGPTSCSAAPTMNPQFASTFGHIRDWIFDLDNCLYPASTGLFELIDERMGAYIQRLLGCDAGRGQARPEGAFPRAWHHARRADEEASTSTRTTSSTTSTPFRSTGSRADDRAGRGAGAAAGAQASSSPTATSPMPGGCSRRSASAHAFRRAARHPRQRLRPKPDPHGYRAAAASASASIPRARAAGRRHGAEPQAGQSSSA